MDINKNLNPNQQKAVESIGNVIIIAGPGTGKTRTLTHKIAYLLQENTVAASDITALTFTKKAAAEMRERVESLISDSENPTIKRNYFIVPKSNQKNFPFIGTFHSLAFKILEESGFEPNVASEKQIAEIVRVICGNYKNKKFKLLGNKAIRRKISLFKTSDIDLSQETKKIVQKYDSELKKRGLSDYDDLLINALNMVKKNKIKYKYVLVDEFQDTNNLQFKLIKALLEKNGELFVIGDPFQSIYGFRGSNIQIFDQLKKDFPDIKQFNINTNYRSGSKIIETSSSLFEDIYSLKAFKKIAGKVTRVKTYNEYSEADWILKEINEKVGGIDLNYAGEIGLEKQTHLFADFAVIYRMHSLSRALEKKFYEFGIPFQIIGSQSLYELAEIKFLILSLRYIAVNVSMYRYMDTLNREELLIELKNTKAVVDPISLIKQKLDALDVKDRKVSDLIKEISDIFFLEKKLEKDNFKQQNLKEFVASTVRFDKQKHGILRFLNYINYLEEHEYYDESADKVTLMTMHASKGLEFPYVYLIGFEEGIIPYAKTVEEKGLDEEKRLLYVAMTRAEDELQLISCEKRFRKKTRQSSLEKLILKSNVDFITDEAIVKIKRKIERSKKKQLNLF